MTTTSTSRPSCAETRRFEGSGAVALATTRACGDLRPRFAGDTAAHQRLVERQWSFARQVHGAAVGVVEAGETLAGPADAIVTSDPAACIAVLGADCGLVGLASREGVTAVAHAGWRGLVAGVIGETAAAVRLAGASDLQAVIGPCIHPCCYAFSPVDLEQVLASCGDAVAGETRLGEPALDLPASLRRALERAGVSLAGELGGCTGCDERFFSWRVRRDEGRQALAVFHAAPGERSATSR